MNVPTELVHDLADALLRFLDEWHEQRGRHPDPMVCAGGVALSAQLVVEMLSGSALTGETVQ